MDFKGGMPVNLRYFLGVTFIPVGILQILGLACFKYLRFALNCQYQ